MNRYTRMSAQGVMPSVRYMPSTPEIIEPSLSLAIAFVMWQEWGPIYEPEAAMNRGTLFPALDLPFTPCGGNRK